MVLSKNISNEHAPGGRTPPGVVFILFIVFALHAGPIRAQTATPSATLVPTAVISAEPTALPTDTPAPTPLVAVSTPEIRTEIVSSAPATLNAVTVVNTTASGGTPQVVNYTQPTAGTINLSGSGTCTATDSAAITALINNAAIRNTVSVSSVVGDSSSAHATANVFNMANTVLTGSCWNFQVANFFAPHTGDILLPSVEHIIHPDVAGSAPAAQTNTMNMAVVSNNLTAIANTGNQTVSGLTTGDASVKVQTQELLNTAISGNNWVFLTIRSYGGWQGSLLNWPGTLIQTPGYIYAYLPPQAVLPSAGVSVTNNASVTNTISVLADTGAASAGNLATGPASASINLFDMLNTTLSGNNWYFGYFSIFDSFTGNFIFPVPIHEAANPTLPPISAEGQAGTTTQTQTASPLPSVTVLPTDAPVLAAHTSRWDLPGPVSPTPPPLLERPAIRTASTPIPSNPLPAQNAGLFLTLAGMITAIIKVYLLLRSTAG